MKSNRYVDLSFIGLLLILSGKTIYSHFAEGFLLSINNYLAFVALALLLMVRLLQYEKTYRLMLLILLLGTFELVNFSIGRNSLGFGKSGENVVQIRFNFYLFLLLIAYCCLNGKIILNFFHRFIKGTEQEKNDEYNKNVRFYYEKFKVCDVDEFNGIYNKYKEYPQEAQAALKQIKAERK